jgi:uncharacterized protein (TIGR00288 family)
MSKTTESSISDKWKTIKNIFKKPQRVSVIIDGPNILRKVGRTFIRLEDIDNAINSELGEISNKYVLLNNQASEKLIQAVMNSGYTPVIVSGDIHLKMGLLALDISKRNNSDIILLASRDMRCTPILMKLKEKGIETAIIGYEPGFSIALKNNANFALELTV